jgi:DNA polymerase IV
MPLNIPTTYLLSAHIPEEKRLQLEDEIPNLTYDITEAKLVLGKVATKQRAEFELRCRNLWTEEVKRDEEVEKDSVENRGHDGGIDEGPTRKKRRTGPSKIPDHVEVIVLDSSTESEAEEDEKPKSSRIRRRSGSSTQSEDVQSPTRVITSSPPREEPPHSPATRNGSQEGPDRFDWGDTIKVVKLSWFEGSVAAGHMLPLDGYIVYEGRQIASPKSYKIAQVCLFARVEF